MKSTFTSCISFVNTFAPRRLMNEIISLQVKTTTLTGIRACAYPAPAVC